MYIQRLIHPEISKHLARKEYTIITGARQSGKTSLMQALFNETKSAAKNATFLSFEDRDILSSVNTHPEEIFAFTPRPEKTLKGGMSLVDKFFLFIDEVQLANDPSNLLKYLFDTYGENLKVVATGSSAFYIDKKFTDSLAGRKRIFKLGTLDFAEWLIFRKHEDLSNELKLIRAHDDYVSTVHSELMEKLDEYLVFGGYPTVVLEDDPGERIVLLKEIKNSFLKRDIDDSGISNPDKFYYLLTLLAGQSGNLLNRNELANTIEVDNKTIEKYLRVLQKCFHVELVRPYYTNLRKELTKMPKVFFMDAGFRNAALNRFFGFKLRDDQGALLENYIYNRLSYLYDPENIRFWRTIDRKEIDFIVNESFREGYACEVKMNCTKVRRQVFEKFITAYPGYKPMIISYDINSNCKWVLKI